MIESDIIDNYLKETSVIDYHNSHIQSLSQKLQTKYKTNIEYIHKAYCYVRDKISHSANITAKHVTLSALEMLHAKHGICYAKSHLLAALLRAQNIPAGFYYQRLMLNDEKYPYLVLHGLNGVYIEELNKWIHLDARKNVNGIDTQFSLNEERLAFTVRKSLDEEDIPVIFVNSNPNVITALTTYKFLDDL